MASSFVCVGTKYCPLLESEGGLALLEPLAQNINVRLPSIQQLAQQVIRRCHRFHLSTESQSNDELDGAAAASAADVNNVDMTDDSDNDIVIGDDADDDSDDSGLDY